MKRVMTALAVIAVHVVLSAAARAETIRITSGALDWSHDGPDNVVLIGDGFTFAGRPGNGLFAPDVQCSVPECTRGTAVDLQARWVGLDLPGTATLNGVTYSVGGASPPDAQLDAQWTGSLTIPLSFTGGALSAPFRFTGLFGTNPLTGTQQRFDLVGSGIATLTFAPFPGFGDAFALESARYEFEAGAAPIPEPGTMILLGSGLSALAALRRRRSITAGRRSNGA